MLAMDLLQGGPGAALRSFTGMVAAHAYFFAAVVRLNLSPLVPLPLSRARLEEDLRETEGRQTRPTD